MAKPFKILLIRLKSMGDIVFTLPAVHAVRAANPSAEISFLVSHEYAPLMDGFREVNAVLELNRRTFRGLNPIKTAATAVGLLRRLRTGRFDLAIDLQGYGETALLTWLTRAPERWGAVYRPGRSWAYSQPIPARTDVHPAEAHLSLLQSQGLSVGTVRNEFVLPEHARVEAGQFLAQHGLRGDARMLFIQPFTSSPQKNWPLERYLELGRRWRDRGWQVLFGGGPGDRLALEAAGAAGFPVAAGVPLLVSAGLANASTLVLGADTGLVHLAVALGKRVVMLMRSPFSGSTHPFRHPEWAISPPNKESVGSIRNELVEEHCAQACAQMGVSV